MSATPIRGAGAATLSKFHASGWSLDHEGLKEAMRAVVNSHFQRLELDDQTLAAGLAICRETRLKPPDALILASARVNGWLLVTRNTNDFPPSMLGVRVPFAMG